MRERTYLGNRFMYFQKVGTLQALIWIVLIIGLDLRLWLIVEHLIISILSLERFNFDSIDKTTNRLLRFTSFQICRYWSWLSHGGCCIRDAAISFASLNRDNRWLILFLHRLRWFLSSSHRGSILKRNPETLFTLIFGLVKFAVFWETLV